jgi:deoxyribodipyrimidine photo-lyase
MSKTQVVWLRHDLRLADQPAFHAAAANGPVVAVYVLDDARARRWANGGAARWWLHHSLASLAASLERDGSRLILRRGDAVSALAAITHEFGAGAVHALHHHEPWWRDAENELPAVLPDACPLVLHHGNYLAPPGSVTTGAGQPYKIYTPFSRALLERMPPDPCLSVPPLSAPKHWPESDRLEDWGLLPTKPNWANQFGSEWTPGEAGAVRRVDAFADHIAAYETTRNLPSTEGTSRLSPHLAFGEISPRQVWHAIAHQRSLGADTFRKELIWRDYAQNVIHAMPAYGARSYSETIKQLPWRDLRTDPAAKADLAAWQKGRTGYPIVDAGMRQLWTTGWMHNRVRMITASFLVKHLLIDWRHGERWFWDTLVDADYASNAVNWQWTAGSGVDANMFVRIMAPLTQSPKFDASAYIRRWVPELKGLDDHAIHDPVFSPRGYPGKLVAHRAARERALAAWQDAKARIGKSGS